MINAPPSKEELRLALQAIVDHEGAEESPRPEDVSRERWMEVVDELLQRGWASAQAINAGDGRLMSVRGLRPTSLGRQVLGDLRREAISSRGQSVNLPLEEKKRRRAALMATLYEFSDGRQLQTLLPEELAERLGWTVEETDAVLEYLEKEGLVDLSGMGPNIGMTHAGVREVEQAMDNPEEPTEHFPAGAVVVVYGDILGSQIQAGNVGSQQSQQQMSLLNRADVIRDVVETFKQVLDELTSSDRPVVEAEIATIETQLASPRPNGGVLRESLRSLRAVAEGMAGNAAFLGALELLDRLSL